MGVGLFIGTPDMPRKFVLRKKLILAMSKCMVSMATHNAILVNGGVPTKTTISQLLFSLDYYPANMPIWVPYGLPIWDLNGECNWVPHGSHMG